MKTGVLGNWILLLTVMLALPFALKPILGANQASTSASSDGGEKLAKDEIIMLMVQVGRMPMAEQNRKMDALWDNPGSSRSPRADFLFSSGSAYLGSYKAQAYLGNAFEHGRGVDRDLQDAYAWYCIALDNPIDASTGKKIRADRDRVRKSLANKTDKDLTDLVREQKMLIARYLAEIRDMKF